MCSPGKGARGLFDHLPNPDPSSDLKSRGMDDTLGARSLLSQPSFDSLDRKASLTMQLTSTPNPIQVAKVKALERQLVELSGTTEEMARIREERAYEERVELIRSMFARRLINRSTATAFSAWVELWQVCG